LVLPRLRPGPIRHSLAAVRPTADAFPAQLYRKARANALASRHTPAPFLAPCGVTSGRNLLVAYFAAAAAAAFFNFSAAAALRRRLVLGGVAGASPMSSAVNMLVTNSLGP